MDIDPQAKDSYGIPKVRIHFQWDENVLKMWEHSKDVCAEVLRAAGGVLENSGQEPEIPGWSLHETGTCRMGNDPTKFVTNRFGQTHDVSNLYVCDASVFLNQPAKSGESNLSRMKQFKKDNPDFFADLKRSPAKFNPFKLV